MKRLLMIPLALAGFVRPALAMTESGFDDVRFATLITCSILAVLAILFCLMVLVAVAYDRMQAKKRQRAVVRVRAGTPQRRRNQVPGR